MGVVIPAAIAGRWGRRPEPPDRPADPERRAAHGDQAEAEATSLIGVLTAQLTTS
jgi:hypothetical protein